MKAGINKEQAQEIRRWLEKQRLPKESIDILLSSQHASNTHKAYRMKKQINTPDGKWSIHFGANWARPADSAPEAVANARPSTDASLKPVSPVVHPATSSSSASSSSSSSSTPPEKPKKDIKSIGEDFLSRTFMGLAEKLKRLQVEDVDKPTMQKIALEVDKDHLAILKKASTEKDTTVGNLIRLAIREYIEKH